MLNRIVGIMQRFSLIFLFLATLVHAGTPDSEERLLSQATPTQACQLQTLKKLGWTFENDPSQIAPNGGKPCQFQSLSEAHLNGGLKLSYPDPQDSQEFLESLNGRLENQASWCGYKLLVSQAVERAQTKLDENLNYTWIEKPGLFAKLLGQDSFLNVPSRYWDSTYGCSRASQAASTAINCFFYDTCSSDCTVGRQVFEYSVQYELYGRKDFDAAFRPGEVVIGDWSRVERSKNPFYRSLNCSYRQDDEADNETTVRYAKLGPQALIGISGYIKNVLGEDYLDQPNHRGENFIITQVSSRAAKSLADHGGLSYFNGLSDQIWDLGKDRQGRRPNSKMRALLKEPFLNETQVWVHPLGEMTLGEHILNQLSLNPQTPYHFKFLNDIVNRDMYKRYVKFQINQCLFQHTQKVVRLDPLGNPQTIEYSHKGVACSAKLDRRGLAQTSITFQPSDIKIVFNNEEVKTILSQILTRGFAYHTTDTKCGLYSCKQFQFHNGDHVTVYAADAKALETLLSY